ncbi:MAG: hypothetical protein ACO1OB_25660 [Archangium sp.]
MRWLALVLFVCACGSLSPRVDGGSDGGDVPGGGGTGVTGGGSGGGGGEPSPCGPTNPWNVALLDDVREGSVTHLGSTSSQTYALAGDDTLSRSVGGDFTLVTQSSIAEHVDMRVSRSGRVSMLAFQRLLACPGNCARYDDFEEFALPRTPIAVCAAVDLMALITTASDAGVTLYLQQPDAGWSQHVKLNLREPSACARMFDDSVFIAGEGAIVHVLADGGVFDDGPDAGLLGRDPANEAWLELDSDGTRLLLGSARGALAERDEFGAWSVTQQFSNQVTAVALDSSTRAWAFDRNGSACRDARGWTQGGVRPDLVRIDSVSIEANRLYVGGEQADGGSGIRFTQLR